MKKTAIDIAEEEINAILEDLTDMEKTLEDAKNTLDEKINALDDLLKTKEEPGFKTVVKKDVSEKTENSF